MASSKNNKNFTLPTRQPPDSHSSSSRRPNYSRNDSYQDTPSHSQSYSTGRRSQRSGPSSRKSSSETLRNSAGESSKRSTYSGGSGPHTSSRSSPRTAGFEGASEESDFDGEGDEPVGPPQLTEGSIANLIRLENRFRDVEGMVGLMMGFRRHCNESKTVEDMLPYYAEEVLRSFHNMKTAYEWIQFCREQAVGTEEPTLIEKAAEKIIRLVEGVKKEQRDKQKHKPRSREEGQSSKSGRDRLSDEEAQKQIEQMKKMVEAMEEVFEKEDAEGRTEEIGDLKTRLFSEILGDAKVQSKK